MRLSKAGLRGSGEKQPHVIKIARAFVASQQMRRTVEDIEGCLVWPEMSMGPCIQSNKEGRFQC